MCAALHNIHNAWLLKANGEINGAYTLEVHVP